MVFEADLKIEDFMDYIVKKERGDENVKEECSEILR